MTLKKGCYSEPPVKDVVKPKAPPMPPKKHAMLCPTCCERPALFVIPDGFFDVCWVCRSNGWIIKNTNKVEI